MNLRAIALTSALFLSAGSLAACGGSSGSFNVPPVSSPGTWTALLPMQTDRASLGAGVVGGVLYAVGGLGHASAGTFLSSVEGFNPTTSTWTAKASMTTGRELLGVGAVANIIYAVGGYAGSSALNIVEAYDPATNTWTGRKPMQTARYGLGVGTINNVLYAVGGGIVSGGGSAYLNTLEAYDPATDTWTTKAPMPTARYGLAVAVANNVLYAIGGSNASGVLNTVEAYDPATNAWTTKAPMTTARSNLAAAALNNTIYAIGGNDSTNPSADSIAKVEAYDPSTNSWTAKASLKETRFSPAAGVVNGVLTVLGGANSGTMLHTVEAFTP